jgi:hypothetical protein
MSYCLITTGTKAPIPEAHRLVFARFEHWVRTLHDKLHAEPPTNRYYEYFQTFNTLYERILTKMATFEDWTGDKSDHVRDGGVLATARTAMTAELIAVYTTLSIRMDMIEYMSMNIGWVPLVTEELAHDVAICDDASSDDDIPGLVASGEFFGGSADGVSLEMDEEVHTTL